jgi:OPT family oligopeptide transporter
LVRHLDKLILFSLINFCVGLGLSCFGAVLATIYTFKPQQVYVSTIFLAVISYILGQMMAIIIPTQGFIGRWFNPHNFNSKEHTAIIIMASSGATCALATETLAAQRLYYPSYPAAAASIFMILSSQMLGYGIAGILRQTLIYPAKMVYPINLPINTLIETLHRDKRETRKKINLFWIVFGIIFVWEVLPEYIMPILTGISVFCLANRDSLTFTNIFGGTNGNEGLGVLSISLDWQYIGSGCLYLPPWTLLNSFLGYLLCIVVFIGIYYTNVWRALDFPFLSSMLFSGDSNSTYFEPFNQTLILNAQNILNPDAVEQVGVPWFSPTYVVAILSNNLAISATVTHMLLWERETIKSAFGEFTWMKVKHCVNPIGWNWTFWKSDGSRRADENTETYDEHYHLMLAYKDAPDWWYLLVLVSSFVVGLICIYKVDSTLPWWGYLITCVLAYVFILFTGALYGASGFLMQVLSLVQMLGGYLHPGLPVANMYFTCFAYNSARQGLSLLKDLKLAQYAHLSPKCTFTAQIVGTIVGSILNYVMMDSIVRNQREILLSIEGTNIWSGYNIQSWNSGVRTTFPKGKT